MILAGDIGGTKTVLAYYEDVSGRLKLVRDEVFPSAAFPTFDAVLSRFVAAEDRGRIDALCLGVAGPIWDGQCKTTNLPWVLSERDLGEKLGIGKVRLLNDLQAAAYGMLHLKEGEMVPLSPGRSPARKGNIAVIAAGTGLGEGLLFWNGSEHQPVASEGGHVDFAPRNDREVDLLRFLQREFGHVSYERILSGPGIYNIYRFLRESGFAPEPTWLKERLEAGDPSATISRVGLAGEHPLCIETLTMFTSIYGAEAGNHALKTLAVGGVFVGGGIAPKLLEKIRDGGFLDAFWDKGRYRSFLQDIPVKIALNPRAPLIGAAEFARRL